jgi:uncharacterized protein YkwD
MRKKEPLKNRTLYIRIFFTILFGFWLAGLPSVMEAKSMSHDYYILPDRLTGIVNAPVKLALPEYTGCGGVDVPVVDGSFEQQVVELVNQLRTDHGLPPLKSNPDLVRAARYHSADMAIDNYFDHDTYDQGNPNPICTWHERITTFYTGWVALGENIAKGQTSPEDVMEAWVNSPTHYANILEPDFWEIGVGYAEDGELIPYWTQDFGKRDGHYPLIIEMDAASTTSQEVEIFIYGEWDEVRLRNETGEWSPWQSFQNSFTWSLSGQEGEKEVFAEMRTSTAQAESSGAIFYETSEPVLGNLPDKISFVYSHSLGTFTPAEYSVIPENISSSDILFWSLSSSADWLDFSPASGATPQHFSVSPNSFQNGSGNVSGSLVVSVTEPGNTTGSPHEIQVTVIFLPGDLHPIYLPIISR